jgi:hypothetical protein
MNFFIVGFAVEIAGNATLETDLRMDRDQTIFHKIPAKGVADGSDASMYSSSCARF